MGFDKTWHDGVYLCTIVKEGQPTVSINPYPGYIFDPVPSLEGVRIQEGCLCAMSYALGVLSWDAFGRVTFLKGVQAPFFGAIPSLWFKFGSFLADFTNEQSLMK